MDMERYSDLCNNSDFFDEEEFKEWCKNFELTADELLGPVDLRDLGDDIPFAF